MTRRIVSGVFLLIALGVLGVIIAGALTSGEQLVVRFLTAIIVAALALYVISDLRLQASDEAAAAASARATVPAPRITTGEEHPPNSTAAFMATVTGKKSKTTESISIGATPQPRQAEPVPAAAATEPEVALHTTATAAPGRLQPVRAEHDAAAIDRPRTLGGTDIDPDATMDAPASPYDDADDEATAWPFNDAEMEPSTSDLAELDDVEGLVAVFAKRTEQQLSESKTLTLAGHTVDSHTVGGGKGGDSPTAFETAFGAGDGDDGADSDDEETAPKGQKDLDDLATNGGGVTTQMEKPTEGVDATTNGGVPMAGQPERIARSNHGVPSDESGVAALARLTAELPTLPAAQGADTYTSTGIAPIIDLRPAKTTPASGIESAIRSGEYGVIASLIEQGMLTTEGPITDRDVRTMVYVAFTSSELRKILAAGGTVDGDNSDLELGGVDVFRPPAVGDAVDRHPFAALDAPDDGDGHEFPRSQAL